MTDPIDPHAPTPEFRAHLAWQVESALRRESRLAAPVTSTPFWRLAALVVFALGVGGAAGVASGHVQDARQRSSLIENVQAELQLAQTRLTLAQAEYQEVRRRFEIGVAGRESMLAAEQQMRALETALKRLELDLQEVQATSRAPRNELTAPVVDQRDFVRERLQIDLEEAHRALAAAEARQAEARARVEVGVAPAAAALEAQAELARARERMALLESRIKLRQGYLRHEIHQEELASLLRRTELRLALERGEQELARARERVTRLRARVDVGLAEPLELKRAEVDLLEHELVLRRLQRELQALDARAK